MFGINFNKRSNTNTTVTVAEANDGFGVNGGFSFFNKRKYSAMNLSAVYCAVEMISNAIAALPIEAIGKTKGTKIVDLFNNTKQSKFMFLKSLMTDLLLYGNAFAYIIRDVKGNAIELRYVQPGDVNIVYHKEKNVLYYECNMLGGKILPKDIIHIYKNSKDGFTGIGILSFASLAIDLAAYTEESASDYYKDGLNVAGLLSAKVQMNKQQAQQALQSVEGNIETGGGKRIKFIPFDLDFKPLTQNAKDAALVESRLYNITEIARYFCISPTLLQDLSHSNYSSIEAANILFLTQTLQPYIYILEDEFNRKLLPKNASYKLNFNETALLRTDSKSTAEYYATLVEKGLLSTNEARVALGYEPVEGGDRITIAYTDIDANTINKNDSLTAEETPKQTEENN